MHATTTFSHISVNGKAFLDQSGNRFMVRGVALSPNSGADLLADDYSDYMQRYVLPELIKLNVNVVRVYQVDTAQSHAKVMGLLQQNGIYVMVGMATSQVSVNRLQPVYSPALFNRAAAIADEFCQYDNTFAFSVGNEVVFPGNIYANVGNNAQQANDIIRQDASVIKSLIGDLKKYMRDNNLRAVPVGMAMQDGATPTVQSWGGIGTDVVAAYYTCGDPDSRADYIGINSYRYLNTNQPGPMNAYDGFAQEVTSLPVPVFLTESGAMHKDSSGHYYTRDWAIVPQMYTESLLYNQLSGQVAFQFFNKLENLGLYVESPAVSPNPLSGSGGTLNPTPHGGADNLGAEFLTAKALSVPMPAAVTSPGQCPAACNPAVTPLVQVTIQNYSAALKVVQYGDVLGTLTPGSATNPVPTSLYVNPGTDLLIQQNQGNNWIPVCKVPAGKLKDGSTIEDNVSWGPDALCTIS